MHLLVFWLPFPPLKCLCNVSCQSRAMKTKLSGSFTYNADSEKHLRNFKYRLRSQIVDVNSWSSLRSSDFRPYNTFPFSFYFVSVRSPVWIWIDRVTGSMDRGPYFGTRIILETILIWFLVFTSVCWDVPERFRIVSVLVGPTETYLVLTEHPKCGFLSCW